MMRRILLTTALVCMLVAVSFAQAPYRNAESPSARERVLQPQTGLNFGGLLDPSRLSMSHQLGMSYSSFGDRGVTQGYYMNTMTYRFNAPVLMRLRLGVTNDPFATSSGMNQPGQSALTSMLDNGEFFGGADLLWKPSDNTSVMISVNRAPPTMARYGSWLGSPYSRYNAPYRMNPFTYQEEDPFIW